MLKLFVFKKDNHYIYLANFIFFIHALLFVYALFGWLVPVSIWIYIGVLFVALVLDLYFGYCFLSKWEFDLRKKVDPETNYVYNFSSYYADKWLRNYISPSFVDRLAHVYLLCMLAITIFFELMG